MPANLNTDPPAYDSQLESPPTTDSSQDLVSHLDDLLSQYLTLLDNYTTLRSDLSKHCSSGFFSLATANRNCTLGSGRRYGEEGYDARMKAFRCVRITQHGRHSKRTGNQASTRDGSDHEAVGGSIERASTEVVKGKGSEQPESSGTDGSYHGEGPDDQYEPETRYTFEIVNTSTSTTTDPGGPSTATSDSLAPNTIPTPPLPDSVSNSSSTPLSKSQASPTAPTPSPTSSAIPSTIPSTTTTPSTASQSPSNPKNPDPLRWYGLLRPSSLSHCQSSFIDALSGPIPALLSTNALMRSVEDEIWDVRRRLGILGDYAYESEPGSGNGSGSGSAQRGVEDVEGVDLAVRGGKNRDSRSDGLRYLDIGNGSGGGRLECTSPRLRVWE